MIHFEGFDCPVQIEKYESGYNAIRLVDDKDGDTVAIASVNIPDLQPDEVGIKNYSENEGVYDVLLNAGIITPSHREVQQGWITIPVCKLTNDYKIN